MLRCKTCKEDKPKDEFYTRPNGSYVPHCKVCYLKNKKARYEKRGVEAKVNSKECATCHETKSAEQFSPNYSYADRLNNNCKSCNAARKVADKFGLSASDIVNMLVKQSNSCDICSETFTKSPHVDHDHTCCGRDKACNNCIRGLLCGPCNLAIGLMRDNPGRLRAAAEYLER